MEEATRGRRIAAAACAAVLACGLGTAGLAAPGTAEAKMVKKPAKVKIKSVKVSKAGKMTVKVAKAKRAKKYQYRVWGAGMRTKTVKTKKRSVSVSVEKAKKTVKVKVRAYNGWRHGKWSTTKSVKVVKAKKKSVDKHAKPAVKSVPAKDAKSTGNGSNSAENNGISGGKGETKHVHQWRTETVHKDATWWENQLTENGFFDMSFADAKELNAVRLMPDPDTWDGEIFDTYMKAVPEGYHNQFGFNCMVEDEPAYDATYRVCDECGKRELVKKKVHKHHWVSRTVHHDEKTVSGDIVWYYVYKDKNDAEPVFKTTNKGGAKGLVNGNKKSKTRGWENAEYRKVIVHEDDHVVCPAYDETYQVCSGCSAERIQSDSGEWCVVRPGAHNKISASTMYLDSYGHNIITY